MQYSETNYRLNIIQYWQQFYPDYTIPKGYHVHHIKPKSLAKQEGWSTAKINHPRNLLVVHPVEHQAIHFARGDKLANGMCWIIKGYERALDIDENGINSWQRALIKNLQCRLTNIDDNGLNSNQRGNKQMVITKANNIDHNGHSLHKRAGVSAAKTKRNNIDASGNDAYSRAIAKTVTTKNNSVDSNGLNSHQREAIKTAKTKRLDVDKDGNDAYSRSATKRSKTMHQVNKQRYPLLYDKETFIKQWVVNGVIRVADCIRSTGLSRYKVNIIIQYHNL